MICLAVATRNLHKLQEIQTILGPLFQYLSLEQLPAAPRLIEDAETFAGNATRKAVQLAEWLAINPKSEIRNPKSESFVVADDSGLEVDALNGAPGVRSARFAADEMGSANNSPDARNNAKLLRLLKDIPWEKRTARFRCVLALTPVTVRTATPASRVCYANEFELQTEVFAGACEGHIDFQPRGERGFGYDPLFIPEGCQQSFAELGNDVKNQLSHRARALAGLRQRFQVGK